MQSGMQAKGQRKEAIIVNQKSTRLSSLQLYKPMKISCLELNQAAVRSFYSSGEEHFHAANARQLFPN